MSIESYAAMNHLHVRSDEFMSECSSTQKIIGTMINHMRIIHLLLLSNAILYVGLVVSESSVWYTAINFLDCGSHGVFAQPYGALAGDLEQKLLALIRTAVTAHPGAKGTSRILPFIASAYCVGVDMVYESPASFSPPIPDYVMTAEECEFCLNFALNYLIQTCQGSIQATAGTRGCRISYFYAPPEPPPSGPGDSCPAIYP